MNFSAQTTSKRTQEMIEEKLEKRKKSLLSAPAGKKVIVFIDDMVRCRTIFLLKPKTHG